jgi:hypothetical protein
MKMMNTVVELMLVTSLLLSQPVFGFILPSLPSVRSNLDIVSMAAVVKIWTRSNEDDDSSNRRRRQRITLSATTPPAEMSTPTMVTSSLKLPKRKTLGLLTFDLDDTLYPISPVIDEANAAFARAMARFGYEGLTPMDIVETGKLIREELAAENPSNAVVLTHTEIRELSIRREMENIMLAKKLQETADDWATPVSDLASIVVANAKK